MNALSPSNLKHPATPGARKRGGWPLRLVAFAAIVGLAAWAVAAFRPNKAAADRPHPLYSVEWPVTRGSMTVSILTGGQTRAKNVTTITCEVPGDVKILWIADEGTTVRKGDLLVELESANLRESLLQQQIRVAEARASYEAAQRDLEQQQRKNETDLLVAKNRVEMARLDLEKFLEGDRIQRERDLLAQIKLAEAELKRAEDRTTWTQVLLEKGFVNRGELEADQLTLTRNQLDLQKATLSKEVFDKFESRRTQMNLEIAITEAERALEALEVTAVGELRKRGVALESARARLELEEAQLKQIADQLEKTKIYAPQDGMVVYSQNQERRGGGSNDTRLEVGATVRNRQRLIDLPDFSAWIVQANVHESMILQVRPGQKVLITLDAFPNEVLTGTVGRIAVLPDSTQWFMADVKEYKVDIDLTTTTLPLKPGMTAKAEIILDQLQDVVFVPIQAVVAREGRTFVMVKTPEGPQIRDIVPGQNNGRFVEVKSGLQPGEIVLMTEQLAPPRSIVDRPSEQAGAALDRLAAPGGGRDENDGGAGPGMSSGSDTGEPATAPATGPGGRGRRGGRGGRGMGGGPNGGLGGMIDGQGSAGDVIRVPSGGFGGGSAPGGERSPVE